MEIPMKKSSLLVFVLFIFNMSLTLAETESIPAGKYSCEVLSKESINKPLTFTFEYTSDQELGCYEDDGEYCMSYFQFTPVNQRLFSLNDLYNGDYGHDENDNFHVFSDTIGCDFGWLVLFKESKYLRGFIRSEFHCSDKDIIDNYGTVSCTREEL